jgi:multimeric flavodoxin WrbA
MAKIIGISGSPRLKHSVYMLKTVLEATNKPFELIYLKDLQIEPCTACLKCMNGYECPKEDDMKEISRKLEGAEIIVLGSPTYFSNVSGIMKNFMDRCLPYYSSERLKNKRTAVLSVGNLKEELEFDAQGNCMWHKEETESVLECQKAMERFCELLHIQVISRVHALHSEPEKKEKELARLGEKIGKLVK